MLDKAFSRLPDGSGLIFHSDQGWQYQNARYQKRLLEKGVRQSMSRKGNCLDNAVMENFFGLLDTVDKSVVLWYNEEKSTGVFLHGEQLSTARYVRCDVGNSQAVHNRKQGNVGRERKGYPSISEWRVLDFENGSTMERPAAGIW